RRQEIRAACCYDSRPFLPATIRATRASTDPKMLILPGAPALSEFRTTRLLAAVRTRYPQIESLRARYVHFAQTRRALSDEERRILEALLTYGAHVKGEPSAPSGADLPADLRADAPPPILVIP